MKDNPTLFAAQAAQRSLVKHDIRVQIEPVPSAALAEISKLVDPIKKEMQKAANANATTLLERRVGLTNLSAQHVLGYLTKEEERILGLRVCMPAPPAN